MGRSTPLVFGYVKFTNDKGESILKPLIRVELQKMHGKEITAIATMALIDSGSDFNVFHADLATALGIDDIKKGDYIGEIGGVAQGDDGKKAKTIHGWRHPIGIKVQDRVRTTDAIFSPDIANYGFCILGQVGFFDKFNSISLSYRHGKIVIKP